MNLILLFLYFFSLNLTLLIVFHALIFLIDLVKLSFLMYLNLYTPFFGCQLIVLTVCAFVPASWKLPVCWILHMTYCLTSKTLWAVTDQKMDSCLWTKACVSLWTEACQSNCRVWLTGLISLAF